MKVRISLITIVFLLAVSIFCIFNFNLQDLKFKIATIIPVVALFLNVYLYCTSYAIFDERGVTFGVFRKWTFNWNELKSIEILTFGVGEMTNYLFGGNKQFPIVRYMMKDYDEINAKILNVIADRKIEVPVRDWKKTK